MVWRSTKRGNFHIFKRQGGTNLTAWNTTLLNSRGDLHKSNADPHSESNKGGGLRKSPHAGLQLKERGIGKRRQERIRLTGEG